MKNRRGTSRIIISFLGIAVGLYAVSSVELPVMPPPPEPEVFSQADIPLEEQKEVGDVQGKEKPEKVSTEIQKNGVRRTAASLETLSMDEVIAFLEPLIRAESEDQIVVAMKNLSFEKVKQILAYVLESSLPRDLKIQIVLGISQYYMHSKHEQHIVLSMINSTTELEQGVPLLAVAARSSYPALIIDLLEWNKDKKKQLVDDALAYLLKIRDLDQFKIVNQYAKIIDAQEASKFLWQAIGLRSPTEFIQYFIDQGADIEQEKDGRTVLVSAVEHLNRPAVELLIKTAQEDKKRDLGKMVNRFVDVHVGTPLQIAKAVQHDVNRPAKDKKIAAEIEVVLRKHGAK